MSLDKSNDKLVIIELNDHDANRLLTLVQREAATGKIWNDYWAAMANRIAQHLEQQKNEHFYQCSACFEG